MVLSSGFSRSRPMMARYDVAPALVKWWKVHGSVNGEVTRSLSPYEQQAMVPWLRTFPKLAFQKFTRSVPYWGSAAAVVIGTGVIGNSLDEAEDFSHRF
mmetsp:Transcript_33164/g.48627  ORF Transcript_33164/g.48627 Transcript_33164/m.48627 type:complete len:99 (-) Transcript_33164:289-585(-)